MAHAERKVLVVDADPARADELAMRLRYLDYEPDVATAQDLNPDCGIAVVVGQLDEQAELKSALLQMRQRSPHTPVITLGESGVTQDAGLKGPVWKLDLPLKRSHLSRLLSRAQRYHGRERRQRITGNSRSIRAVRTLIEQVADFDTNVLVTGESGTGKELVARTIHDLSERADKPFVPINCGAIPEELLESELFGHKKGAFTGAIADRTGRFELAEGGTLFLDEIGDMSLPMQVKLLRVLQEKCFERIGGNRTLRCNVRIIAATHRDLPAAVAEGAFREDLYYRLNVFPIEMPPLCKRVSDLPLLMEELLVHHQGSDQGTLRVSSAALRCLAAYDWPGNIRELGNLVERLAIIKPQGVIDVDDLPPKYTQGPSEAHESVSEPNPVSEALRLTEANLKEHLQSVEQDLIGQAMQASDGVVARAARLLNMRRTTLVEKLNKYQIH